MLVLKQTLISKRAQQLTLLDSRVIVLRGVFNPRIGYSTYILLRETVRRIVKEKFLKVCETCAGSGVIGVFCANKLKTYVVLCDISRICVRNCRVNALLARCYDRIDLVVCDALSCFRDRCFDLVLMNPPYLPCPRKISAELCCGSECTLVLEMLRQALRTVKTRGTVLFTISSLSDLSIRHFRIVSSEWSGLDHIYVCEAPVVLD